MSVIRTIGGEGNSVTMRAILVCMLAIGLLAGLSACAPGYYYPAYPGYYAPAYRAPAGQSTTRAQRQRDQTQAGSGWVNPEPEQ
jgi:hypothetical protein